MSTLTEQFPKINTLWMRTEGEKKGAVLPGKFSEPVFSNIKNWIATEKIDGTNTRIFYSGTDHTISFYGKTDDATFHPEVIKYLQETFTLEKFQSLPKFDADTDYKLFSETCHEKIGDSKVYLNGAKVVTILFDVKVGNWWLENKNVREIANHFNVPVVSARWIGTMEDIIEYVANEEQSVHSDKNIPIEGLVCTAFPMVLNRDGSPVRFKLKVEDFRKLRRLGKTW